MQSRLFAMIFMACLPFAALLSQSEFLDPAFGQNGRQLVHFLPSDDQGFAVVQHPDGRILVVGRSVIDSANQFAITQYLPDGRPDLTFDIDGKKTVNFGNGQEIAYAAALLPDGRSVVAGFAGPGGLEDFAVARLMPDGLPDLSFAGTGRATFDFNFGMDYAYSVLYQPDGKTVLAGYTSPDGFESDFALIRLLPDGQPDPDFGTDGRVVQSFSTVSDLIFDAKLQPDGKIVVAGQAYAEDFSSDFIVARYRPDGTLDSTFADNGVALLNLGDDDLARGLSIQNDGKIVVAGVSVTDFLPRVGVTRLQPDGQPDMNFGSNGILLLEPGPAGNFCTDVLVQPNGGILLSGMIENVDFRDFFLMRRLPNGAPDLNFGDAGLVVTSVSNTNDNAYRLALQNDGKILLAGTSERLVNADITLLRYSSDGKADLSFGQNGVVLTDVGASRDVLSKLLVLPDQKILCAGLAYKTVAGELTAYPGILQLHPDGRPDTDFGDGISFLNPAEAGLLADIVRLPNGQIAGAGLFDGKAGLIRLNQNGLPDATFGVSGIATSSFAPLSSFHTLALTPNGKMLAGGASPLPQQEGILVRYQANGNYDLGFGLNGQAQAPAGFLSWEQLVSLTDGNFLALGTRWVNGASRDYLVKFLENGSPDLNFGSGGLVIDAGLPAGLHRARTFIRLESGKLLVAGGGNALAFAQLLPNGAPDPDFGVSGFIAHQFGADGIAFVNALAIQDNGRIVAAGTSGASINPDLNNQFVLLRLHPNGNLDTNFGLDGFIRLNGRGADQVVRLDNGQLLAGGIQYNGLNDDVLLVRIIDIPTVGVIDAASAGDISVALFPNPVQHSIQISYELEEPQTVLIDCFDEGGRLRTTFLTGSTRQAGPQQETLELPADWPAGVYTLVVQAGAGRKSLKFVKL
ncbi:MAG: T9SS type A sorting domain-containing protein [Saprospiraceae bacterium]